MTTADRQTSRLAFRQRSVRLARMMPATVALAATLLGGCAGMPGMQDTQPTPPAVATPRAPKVVIVTMFAPEAKAWADRLGPWQDVPVAGLSPDYPTVKCNAQDVCLMTTGMGHTNAAASTMALVLSPAFDLSRSYVLIAGIAGINPEHGTVGSVAWARYLVDFGIQWELDAREKPRAWPSGMLGINTKGPNEKPPLDYKTEVFQLDEALLQRAYALTRSTALTDAPEAKAARAKFKTAPANQPPRVTLCDTLAGDTWFSGKYLGERATAWTKQLTDGKGVYCTTQQEDNATYEAFKRGAALGKADVKRIAVLRGGSDFDRPAPGQTAEDNLLNYQQQGGFGITLENLYLAGLPLLRAIVQDWDRWKEGVPPAQ